MTRTQNRKSETLRASRDQSSTAKMAKDNNEKGLVHDANRNPKQEFRNVAAIVPTIKHGGKCVEKDNEILCTKNDGKRVLVTIFHGIDVKIEAGDRKWLTPKNNKGKETFRIGNDDVSSLENM